MRQCRKGGFLCDSLSYIITMLLIIFITRWRVGSLSNLSSRDAPRCEFLNFFLYIAPFSWCWINFFLCVSFSLEMIWWALKQCNWIFFSYFIEYLCLRMCERDRTREFSFQTKNRLYSRTDCVCMFCSYHETAKRIPEIIAISHFCVSQKKKHAKKWMVRWKKRKEEHY